jgi:regulatory protein
LRAGLAPDELQRRQAAVAYARRRRFGPFSREPLSADDRQGREKQLAALLRAGHDLAHARQVVTAMSENALEHWIGEAREEKDDAR